MAREQSQFSVLHGRIKQTGITFSSNVELVAFAGEEQGLVRSRAYVICSSVVLGCRII